MIEIGSFITSSMMELSSTISQLDSKINILIEKLTLMTSIDFTTPLQKFFKKFSLSGVINKVISAFECNFLKSYTNIFICTFFINRPTIFLVQNKCTFPKKENRIRVEHILVSISKGVKAYIFITTLVSLLTGFLTFVICEIFSLQGAVYGDLSHLY